MPGPGSYNLGLSAREVNLPTIGKVWNKDFLLSILSPIVKTYKLIINEQMLCMIFDLI